MRIIVFLIISLFPSLLFARTLGVLPFEGKGIDDKMKAGIRSLATSEIDIMGIYDVFLIDEKEAGAISADCYSKTSCLKEKGLNAKMNYLLVGSISRRGNMINLTLKLFNVAAEKVVKTLNKTISSEPEAMAMEMPAIIAELFPKGKQNEEMVTPFGKIDEGLPPPPAIEQEPKQEAMPAKTTSEEEFDVLGIFEEKPKDKKRVEQREVEEEVPPIIFEEMPTQMAGDEFEDLDISEKEKEKMRKREEKAKLKEEKRRAKEAKKREREIAKAKKREERERRKEEKRKKKEAKRIALESKKATKKPEVVEESFDYEVLPAKEEEEEEVELPEIHWKSSLSEIKIENVEESGEIAETTPPPVEEDTEEIFTPSPPAVEKRYSYETIEPPEETPPPYPPASEEDLDIGALLGEEEGKKKEEEKDREEVVAYRKDNREKDLNMYDERIGDYESPEVKIIKGWKEEKNIVSLLMKGGYGYYYYHMINFAGELDFFPTKEVAISVGAEAMNGYYKADDKDDGIWFYIIPFNIGVKYIKTGDRARPFIGADILMIAYDNSFDLSYGIRAVGGVNYFFTKYLGLHAGVNLGFAYGSKMENLGDYSKIGFIFQTIAGPVIIF